MDEVHTRRRPQIEGAPDDPTKPALAPAHVDLRVRMLGELVVKIDGRRVHRWSGTRGRLLLVYVLLHAEHPIPRDRLLELFWPAIAPSVARNRFHVTLNGLRRDLRVVSNIPIVVHRRTGYAIGSQVLCWTDVAAFQERLAAARACHRHNNVPGAITNLEGARALYRGALLLDRDASWLTVERENARRRYVEVLERLARLRFEFADYERSIDAAQELVANDPGNESAHRLLMRSFVRQQQPHCALRQFEACRHELVEQFDLPPSAETIALYRAIRMRAAV
jgi:DNA-binding SARP family transcriptional activator